MDIIKKHYIETLFISNIFNHYFGNLNLGFLDIETTGLNSSFNKVFLIGILTVHENEFIETQFFADSKEEEKRILKEAALFLSDIDLLITYNGSTFDIPFLNKRFDYYGIEYRIPRHISFDLYQIIRKYGYNLFPDYKLKTIENYLGIERKDTLSGKECILLYQEYLKSANPAYKKNILLHNREDVYNLTKILPLLNKYDLHKILFENNRYVDRGIVITESKISGASLRTLGYANQPEKDYYDFQAAYTFNFDVKTKTFHLTLPLYEDKGLYYLDPSEFPISYSIKNPPPLLHQKFLWLGRKEELNYLELNAFLAELIKQCLSPS
ncbi:MAG: ribonuclease H-like domain-containing protein [Peptostreptococcales bacterium]